ncbi:MAG: prepilin-type N-terminal cleavage/methylation domain-containing protein [Clostridiales bacterium]|nr:prepilin-type N-terminal cleavage/methylation domain-containing protein [Clostridiales bacterium]
MRFVKVKMNRGMTLIEVIIAMAIIGIIAVGLIQMFTMSMIVISNAGKKTQSAYDAQKHAEHSLTSKYSNTPDVDEELLLTIGGTTIIAPGRKVKVESQLSNGEIINIEVFQPKH